MRVELEKIRLGVNALSGTVSAGIPDSDISFKHQTDVTSDFIKCVIDKFGGMETTITVDDTPAWIITVKKYQEKD